MSEKSEIPASVGEKVKDLRRSRSSSPRNWLSISAFSNTINHVSRPIPLPPRALFAVLSRGLEGLQVRIGEADPVVDDGEAFDGFNRWPSGYTRQLVLLASVHMHLNVALLSCMHTAKSILNRVDAVDDGSKTGRNAS